MLNWIIAIGYFVLSVINDALNVKWHVAREGGRAAMGGNISLAMGLIAWLPYVLFVTSANWQIIIADLAGNWLGSYLAIRNESQNADLSELKQKGRRSFGNRPDERTNKRR